MMGEQVEVGGKCHYILKQEHMGENKADASQLSSKAQALWQSRLPHLPASGRSRTILVRDPDHQRENSPNLHRAALAHLHTGNNWQNRAKPVRGTRRGAGPSLASSGNHRGYSFCAQIVLAPPDRASQRPYSDPDGGDRPGQNTVSRRSGTRGRATPLVGALDRRETRAECAVPALG